MGLILAIIIVTPLLGFVALIGFDKSGEFSESDNLFLKIIMCYATGVLVYLGLLPFILLLSFIAGLFN